MRGFVKLTALFLVLTTALLWSGLPDPFGDPGFLHAQRASAQFGILGPGGMITTTYASSSLKNSTGEFSQFKYIIAPALVATSFQLSTTGTTTTQNIVGASVPLHLHCNGTINTAAGASVYFGANFGGTTASISLLNGAQIGNLTAVAPMQTDVWLAPIATSTTGATVFMTARIAFGENVNASETAFSGAVLGTTALGSPSELNVNWRFGAAAASSGFNSYGCVLVQGL